MPKAFIFGGLGYLGYKVATHFVSQGYEVKTVDLKPLTAEQVTEFYGADNKVEYLSANFGNYTDEQVIEVLKGCTSFVYCAGADERITATIPSASFYYERNVLPTVRMVKLAAAAGIKKFVILGSYTAYFALNLFPELHLMEQGYPQTRVLQELVSINEGTRFGVDVCVLRLPYIFGCNKTTSNVPLWAMYREWIKQSGAEGKLYCPEGSTAAVTHLQVAEAALGAVEHGAHGGRYHINGRTLRYTEFYGEYLKIFGFESAEVVVVPTEHRVPAMEAVDAAEKAQGREHGIHMAISAVIQGKEATYDVLANADVLKYQDHDVFEEMRQSIQYIKELEEAGVFDKK